jgi:hypothetical protein
MNKAFCTILLFFSILLILSALVYLINTRAQQIIASSLPWLLSNQPSLDAFTQIYTTKPGGRVFSHVSTNRD